MPTDSISTKVLRHCASLEINNSASVRGGSSGAVAPLDFEKVEIAPLNF